MLEQRREGAEARGEATATMPPGLVAGTETIVFYTLFLMLPSQRIMLFGLMAALVLVNVVWRLIWAGRRVRA